MGLENELNFKLEVRSSDSLRLTLLTVSGLLESNCSLMPYRRVVPFSRVEILALY